jgi:hypothetical protein
MYIEDSGGCSRMRGSSHQTGARSATYHAKFARDGKEATKEIGS